MGYTWLSLMLRSLVGNVIYVSRTSWGNFRFGFWLKFRNTDIYYIGITISRYFTGNFTESVKTANSSFSANH